MQNLFLIGTMAFTGLMANCAFAQVSPDATLSTTITQQGSVITIDGGTSKGSNLFHGFTNFSPSQNQTAFFNNNLNVRNIIARISGGTRSDIFGTIQANGSANLFLINPSGIFFGPNSRLNIGGSFFGTTATSIFAGNQEFLIDQLSPANSFSGDPSALKLTSESGSIRIEGQGHVLTGNLTRAVAPTNIYPQSLSVSPGNTLSLIGNGLSLDGGVLAVPSGRVSLISARNDTVSLTQDNLGFALTPTQNALSDITLTNASLLESVGMGTGSIEVIGKTVDINRTSKLWSQTFTPNPGSDITVDSVDFVLSNPAIDVNSRFIETGIFNNTVGLGPGGNITVRTNNLSVLPGAGISTATYAPGKSGDINFQVANTANIVGTDINNFTASAIGIVSFFGPGGEFNFNADRIILSNRAVLNTAGFGPGDSGNLNVTARQIELSGGSTLGTITLNSGNAGDAVIKADFIRVSGESPTALTPSGISATTLGEGKAGNLLIEANRLEVLNGGSIGTTAVAQGDAGNLDLNIRDSILISGVAPITNSPSNINSAVTRTPTQFSPVALRFLNIPEIPSGRSGTVRIKTKRIDIEKGGSVSVQNSGPNDAGALVIKADRINLNKGFILATTASGKGGNIDLSAKLLKATNSEISSSAMGNGPGGNITIDADLVLLIDKSNIFANAENAQGGNIRINTTGFIKSPDSQVTATSQLGEQFDGNVEVEAEITNFSQDPDLNITTGPPELYASCGPTYRDTLAYYRVGTAGQPVSPDTLPDPGSRWLQVAKARYNQRQLTYADPKTGELKPLKRVVGWKTNPNGKISFVNDPRKADQFAPAIASILQACQPDQTAKAG
ncbi:filamentous hemagglutinin N-terminal domain-containing protein [Acaryochloris sp. CCMEE 5410]|uniref:two-partner secretion domain-containing protein n=1 Tax=Acaryochloris sp. CCMEE 5410 TaxID=310037 RepID=UPI0002485235|nr:filamentous hemagglutinin N-terminal domain-containing protein [Acaryochloris sp. CCMEE 5410]KAI9130177.1 filamentous hemagglutinin N-terminal domain-containing protein [Acaryochloris sp. CCMEE 5410]